MRNPFTNFKKRNLESKSAPVADPDVIGPFLRFGTMNADDGIWTGSVLVLMKSSNFAVHGIPHLLYTENHLMSAPRTVDSVQDIDASPVISPFTRAPLTASPQVLAGVRLEKDLHGYDVYRFNLKIRQSPLYEKSICYVVHNQQLEVTNWEKLHEIFVKTSAEQSLEFFIPKFQSPFQWFFYSCDGLSSSDHTVPVDDEILKDDQRDAMWLDVKSEFDGTASGKFCHLMVGVGDQIYNDGVFTEVVGVKDWLSKLRKQGPASEFSEKSSHILNAPVAEETSVGIDKFYFQNYIAHFQRDAVKKIMATVPQVMIWDDHDIFDGYGSYSAPIQQSPTIRAIFDVAKRFYLLFQHHTTYSRLLTGEDNPEMLNTLQSHSFLKVLDPTVAILGLDLRSDRTRDQCMSMEMWNKATQRLNQSLPKTIQHLVVIQQTPVIWPSVLFAESALELAGAINKRTDLRSLMKNSPMFNSLFYPFNYEPDLLDDVVDQWSSERHADERRWMVDWLQKYAENNKIRVTFISGDSHACGIGRFLSNDTSNIEECLSSLTGDVANIDPGLLDHRLMYNVTSSAIVKQPPPNILVQLEHLSAWLYFDRPKPERNSVLEFGDAGHDGVGFKEMPEITDEISLEMSSLKLLAHKDSHHHHFPSLTSYLRIGEETNEEMLDTFVTDVDDTPRGMFQRKIMNRRNWCSVTNTLSELITVNNADVMEGLRLSHLQFHLRVESPRVNGKSIQYHLEVPPLLDIVEVSASRMSTGALTTQVDDEDETTAGSESDEMGISPPSCMTNVGELFSCFDIRHWFMKPVNHGGIYQPITVTHDKHTATANNTEMLLL